LVEHETQTSVGAAAALPVSSADSAYIAEIESAIRLLTQIPQKLSTPSSPGMGECDIMRFFRADAAYAIPALYERLEEAGYFYAIRMKKNAVLEGCIAHRLTRPVGRGSSAKRREAHLRRLPISGSILGQTSSCHRLSRVASRRVVPARRLRCHQSTNGTRLDHPVLQPTRNGSVVYQRRQASYQLDAIVLEGHGAERGPPSASRTGLQSRRFPARGRTTRRGG
jgi:hypothetical protein